MTIIKKAIVGAVGAVVSYYMAQYVMKMLEEKPLRTRVRDAKSKVADMRSKAGSKLSDVKGDVLERVQNLTEKVNSLVQEKSDKTRE